MIAVRFSSESAQGRHDADGIRRTCEDASYAIHNGTNNTHDTVAYAGDCTGEAGDDYSHLWAGVGSRKM
jgi:hypothetical protein